MSRSPEVAAMVKALVGSWSGHGSGGYPTIEPFDYRESTVFIEREDHPALHYEQRAWRQTPDGEVVSHWETGLLRLSSDRSAALFNAQGGRTEAMTGTWDETDDGWQIDLASVGYAGDIRVRHSSRRFSLGLGVLTYEMSMDTASTNSMTPHLEASLTKRT
jgi:hypothetical protein